MNRRILLEMALCSGLALFLGGCGQKVSADAKSAEPPPAVVEREPDADHAKVDHPEQFPLAQAIRFEAASELTTTGVVSADVARSMPVISLAAGRVIEISARLGDTVQKGQLLLKIQSADISTAFSEYRQAMADEVLARTQLERAKILFDKGAIAQKDVEVAQDADAKAKVTVETAREHIRVLGADANNPTSIIEIHAPASGVITDQQVTQSSGVQGLASPNPFTISDLSSVWILCDVYENDLAQVRVGEYADIKLNAYPNMALKGRISNISPVMDPALRTAKVRLEVKNPGTLRIGMFVTATFHGMGKEVRTSVPATAILHLHDRDWAYVPEGAGRFRRIGVVGGKMLSGNQQEILSGLEPGQQVVSNALVLQNTVEQ